jgi:dGTPase
MPLSKTVESPFGAALAPYACQPSASRGRLHPEPESRERTPHQRDRDRILHSGAFRKLEYKTQVFIYHEGDYYRTRLTHSLEVAQIARSVARSLHLNEDLAEALALAHDLGHTPFGHAGEDALDACMKPYGGFDHNDQALRVLVQLEQRYADFDGLNLCWETVEGVVKHNGPLTGPHAGRDGAAVPPAAAALDARWPLGLASFAGAEAQAAAIADDVAYNAHDIDDGLRAGLFGVDDLAAVPLVGPIVADIAGQYGRLPEGRMIHETVRRMIGEMVDDLLAESRARLKALSPGSADDIRGHGRPVVAFSEAMAAKDRALKSFLFTRMYRHYKVNRMASKARRVVRDLFQLFMAEPNTLPQDWQRSANEQPEQGSEAGRARQIADYIAGMTDRYALLEHQRLFDLYAKT